jgi:hypothetical protein
MCALRIEIFCFKLLFCSKVEEIKPFSQLDLVEKGVYILDAYFECFVWVGSEAETLYNDIRLALETVQKYAEFVVMKEKDRKESLSTWLVKSGEEPDEFCSCFLAFDNGTEDFSGSKKFVRRFMYFLTLNLRVNARIIDFKSLGTFRKINYQ